ncbi:hypothetical protein HDU93_008434 [Gonapodya sp. JEL0774]|nr:hypothetical protein HDU93_008434 [Gonapodya sp. JEL0774]
MADSKSRGWAIYGSELGSKASATRHGIRERHSSDGTTLAHKVFLTAELLKAILMHLAKKDLAACAQVCVLFSTSSMITVLCIYNLDKEYIPWLNELLPRCGNLKHLELLYTRQSRLQSNVQLPKSWDSIQQLGFKWTDVANPVAIAGYGNLVCLAVHESDDWVFLSKLPADQTPFPKLCCLILRDYQMPWVGLARILSHVGRTVTSLDLSFTTMSEATRLSYKMVVNITDTCPNLEYVAPKHYGAMSLSVPMALVQKLPKLVELSLAGHGDEIIPDGLAKMIFDDMVVARKVPFRLYFRWKEEDLDDTLVEEMQQWPDPNLGGHPPLEESESVLWMESYKGFQLE